MESTNFFRQGKGNTLQLTNRAALSFNGEFIPVYTDTVIDKWYVGDFASVDYLINVEFNNTATEVMRVLVNARPNSANYTVYARSSISDQLITIHAVITNSYLTLTATAISPYNGARVTFTATYAESCTNLSPSHTVNSVTSSQLPVRNLTGGVLGSIPYQSGPGVTALTMPGSTGQILTTVTTGSAPSWQYPSAGGGLTPTSIKSAPYTAVANELVRVNTTVSAFSITLPTSPIDGTIVGFLDVYGTCATNNLTILPSVGTTIVHDTSIVIDVNDAYISCRYTSANSNWSIEQTPRESMSIGGGWLTPTSIKSAPYTAVANELVRVNTTDSAFSVTLPNTPADGIAVGFLDVYGTCTTNNLTILPSAGTTIGHDTSSIIDVNGVYISFRYTSANSNWSIEQTPAWSMSIGGGLIPTSIKSAPYTAVANELVRVNTTVSAFSITLPTSPIDGTIVGFLDVYGTCATNNLTILSSAGTTVANDTTVIFDLSNAYLSFIYTAVNSNWSIQQSPSILIPANTMPATTLLIQQSFGGF